MTELTPREWNKKTDSTVASFFDMASDRSTVERRKN